MNLNVFRKCKHGIFVYKPKDMFVGSSLEIYGQYAEQEVALFEDLIKKTDAVVDVGANIGAQTVVLSRLAKTAFAFEPERHAFNNLCANISLNNITNTYCFHQAVGNQNTHVKVPELDLEKTNNFGAVNLLTNHNQSVHYLIPLISLDDLLPTVDFLKIDVNGMEKEVLFGARNIIKANKPSLYIKTEDKTIANLLKFFNYEIYEHRVTLFDKDNYFEQPTNIFPDYYKINFFCHHKDISTPVDVEKFGLVKV